MYASEECFPEIWCLIWVPAVWVAVGADVDVVPVCHFIGIAAVESTGPLVEVAVHVGDWPVLPAELVEEHGFLVVVVVKRAPSSPDRKQTREAHPYTVCFPNSRRPP